MKTYKQDLLKSGSFFIAIAFPIFLFFLIFSSIIRIWSVQFLVAACAAFLFALCMMLLKFSQLWYIAVDEKKLLVGNGVYRSCKNLYPYDTLNMVYFGYSFYYGIYVKILKNDNQEKTYPILLVKNSDIKLIVKRLQEHGVNVNTTKLPEKYN